MRHALLSLLAGAAAFARAQSLTKSEDDEPTTFNGIEVPPLLDLSQSNWDKEIGKTKYVMIKHYSPYCSHCIQFAPTYQTLYEFYYTSKPEIADAKDTNFLEYYDFRFAVINCIANYDLCVEHGVQSYPTSVLYANGEPVGEVKGVKNMTMLSEIIEPVLEKQKPGSRPKTLVFPEPGTHELPEVDEAARDAPQDSAETDELPAKMGSPDMTDEISELPAKRKGAGSSNKPAAKSPEKVIENFPDLNPKKDTEKPLGKAAEVESKLTALEDEQRVGSHGNWKMPTAAELFNQRKPKKQSATPNPNGISVALTAETFQKTVTMTQDPWFVKFYAPWCPHCKAMGPTWQQLAKNMQGKLNIGEVNCDIDGRLCKDVHATSYPTLLFFKGGERAEYHGLRGLGDFVNYATKALDLAGGVPDVDAEAFEALEAKEEVIFVYFYDHATTTEDLLALERIPLSLIGHAKLVKTNDPALYARYKITTWPRLLVSREGRPTYYTPLTPDAMRDVHQVLDWMRSVWLPLVPEMTAANAQQIMDGKVVALGILDREDQDTFQGALREMKSAANEWMDRQIQQFQLERKKLRDAKQMRIEEAEDRDDQRALRSAKAIRISMDQAGRKEVAFAWVDGVFWQRWVRTTFGIDVKDGERVIINDQDSRKYWDNSVTGNYILVSRTSIMETLDTVVYGPQTIKPKLTVSAFEKVFLDIRNGFSDHPFLWVGCIASILFGVVSWYRSRSRRARGHFRLDDTIGYRDLKDGLLGQNGNAKAD